MCLLVLFPQENEPPLCLASIPPILWVRIHWEAFIIPVSPSGRKDAAICISKPVSPTSSLNKSQLHLGPKLQVAWLSLDSFPVWGGEEQFP